MCRDTVWQRAGVSNKRRNAVRWRGKVANEVQRVLMRDSKLIGIEGYWYQASLPEGDLAVRRRQEQWMLCFTPIA